MSADADFLDRLDAAIGCQQCGGPLGSSPSDDFCGTACQRRWHAQNTDPLPPSWDAATVYVGEDSVRVPLNEGGPADALIQQMGHLQRVFLNAFTTTCSGDDCDRTVTTVGFTRRCPTHEREHQQANWRLQRQTGNYHQDMARLHVAERWASTDAQRAACRLRRQQLSDRRPRISINVDASGMSEQLRRMAAALADSRQVTWRQPRSRGQHATWAAIDELYRHGFVTTDQPRFRGGGPVTVTYDEPYRTDDSPDPDPRRAALVARQQRNTGPPPSRLDGRRGRGGPRR